MTDREMYNLLDECAFILIRELHVKYGSFKKAPEDDQIYIVYDKLTDVRDALEPAGGWDEDEDE